MYKVPLMKKSSITSVELLEGETIEQKVERIQNNKEPIKDGAPEIFTERKDGVLAAYNIRTDRWEVACEAMNHVAGSIAAKREERLKAAEEKIQKEVAGEPKDGEPKSIQGKSQSDTKD